MNVTTQPITDHSTLRKERVVVLMLSTVQISQDQIQTYLSFTTPDLFKA